MEKYYSVAEIATQLNLSKGMVRRIFRDRAGVLRIGQRGRRAKREYLTLRVPENAIQAFLSENAVPESPARTRHRQASADAVA